MIRPPCPSEEQSPLVPLSTLISAHQEFFRPTPALRRLLLMLHLNQKNTQPQVNLARGCAMSPAMVNKYIEQLSAEQWLQVEPVDGRSLRYKLTDTGQQMGMDLLDACSAEVVRFYAAMRDLIQSNLMQYSKNGLRKLALFGASATGELIMAAAQGNVDIEIVAVADSDPARQGNFFWGHKICRTEELRFATCDAVLIASWGQKKNMCALLSKLCVPHKVITL